MVWCYYVQVNAEHKKLNEANEGSAIFLEELDKVWHDIFTLLFLYVCSYMEQ